MRWRGFILAVLLLPLTAADDPNPPVILDVAVEEASYGPGDLVHVWVHAQDDFGITTLHAYAGGPEDLLLTDGPNAAAPYGQGCSDPGGKRSVTVECVFRLHDQTPAGTYQIHQVTARDGAGHRSTDQPTPTFIVDSPYNDTSAPHIESVDVKVKEATANAAELTIVNEFAELFLSDETGAALGHLGFIGPNGNQGLEGECEPDTGHGSLLCDLYIHQGVPNGDYTLHSVGAHDVLGYQVHYADAHGWKTKPLSDLMDERPVIHVNSSSTDSTPPRLEGITFPSSVHRGQPFRVYMNWTEETAIQRVHTLWQASRGNAVMGADTSDSDTFGPHDVPCTSTWDTDPHFSCELQFPTNFPLGLVKLVIVGATDTAWNSRAYVANEWGWAGDHTFEDDDLHDVAIVLEPRPLEGQVAAIDAVINEVQAGETADIVYDAPPDVKLVEVQMEDATGEVLDGVCDDGAVSQLGRYCHLDVPEDVEGVFELRALTVDGSEQTQIYEDSFPLLAVNVPMPDVAYLDQPAKSLQGIMNTVGQTWKHEQAKETHDPLWDTTESPPGDAKNLPKDRFSQGKNEGVGTVGGEKTALLDDHQSVNTTGQQADQSGAPDAVSTPSVGGIGILLVLALASRRRGRA